jgi:hypothetical protein
MTITQDTTVLDGQSIDIINNAVLGNTPLVTYKTSPWNIDKLEQYAGISMPMAILETDGITLLEDDPQIISRDDIVPIRWGQTKQCRVGTNIFQNYVEALRGDIAIGWAYSAKLPVVEKLKKPIPKENGKGHYHYRIVDARHRFEATMEYKDFPCYVVEGHEADIELLSQKLNNPSMTDKKKDGTDDDVQATIQTQIEWFEKTKGKKGVKPDATTIVAYLTKHFPDTQRNQRKRFAYRCITAVGILQDLEDLQQTDIAKLLREYHPDRVNNGKKDNKGRVGVALRIGRNIEQFAAYIDMAQSQIKYYEDEGVVPPHYFIASFTMGSGVGNQPTTKNLDQKRADVQGIWMKEFVHKICLPVARMYDNETLVEPTMKCIAQNNGKGETPDKLY